MRNHRKGQGAQKAGGCGITKLALSASHRLGAGLGLHAERCPWPQHPVIEQKHLSVAADMVCPGVRMMQSIPIRRHAPHEDTMWEGRWGWGAELPHPGRRQQVNQTDCDAM